MGDEVSLTLLSNSLGRCKISPVVHLHHSAWTSVHAFPTSTWMSRLIAEALQHILHVVCWPKYSFYLCSFYSTASSWTFCSMNIKHFRLDTAAQQTPRCSSVGPRQPFSSSTNLYRVYRGRCIFKLLRFRGSCSLCTQKPLKGGAFSVAITLHELTDLWSSAVLPGCQARLHLGCS